MGEHSVRSNDGSRTVHIRDRRSNGSAHKRSGFRVRVRIRVFTVPTRPYMPQLLLIGIWHTLLLISIEFFWSDDGGRYGPRGLDLKLTLYREVDDKVSSVLIRGTCP